MRQCYKNKNQIWLEEVLSVDIKYGGAASQHVQCSEIWDSKKDDGWVMTWLNMHSKIKSETCFSFLYLVFCEIVQLLNIRFSLISMICLTSNSSHGLDNEIFYEKKKIFQISQTIHQNMSAVICHCNKINTRFRY